MRKDRKEKVSAYMTRQNVVLAKLAIEQYGDALKKEFPNIICLSDAVHDLNHHQTHVVAIYLIDHNTEGLPEKLQVKMPGGRLKFIATEIITGLGKSELFFSQRNGIKNGASIGSICCMVQMPDKIHTGIVTAGHVFSKGYSNLANGWVSDELATSVALDDSIGVGNWAFLMLDTLQDMAVITLSKANADPDFIRFASKGTYKVGDKDIKKEKVTLVSKIKGERAGFILDYNCTWPVEYFNGVQVKNNIILIGSTNNRDTSVTLSEKGDSGGCVYHTETGKLVGLILGGDNKYTWVLPLSDTLSNWDFTLL